MVCSITKKYFAARAAGDRGLVTLLCKTAKPTVTPALRDFTHAVVLNGDYKILASETECRIRPPGASRTQHVAVNITWQGDTLPHPESDYVANMRWITQTLESGFWQTPIAAAMEEPPEEMTW